jgi:hypothetical protein
MFGRSPIADIHHLLNTIPVDIDRLARHDDHDPVDEPDPAPPDVSLPERRYRKAIAVAKHRLIADAPIRASVDHYLIQVINHHARSIMMPRHLVLAVTVDGMNAVSVAAKFQVPVDVAKARLEDHDLRQAAVQKASR